MRTTRISRFAAVAAAASLALTAALATASGASAKATPASTAGAHQPAGVHHAAMPNTPAGPSADGAGYFVSLAGVSSISVNFTMPDYSCASPDDNEWLLPGIWAFTTGGSRANSQADVNFNCDTGFGQLNESVACANTDTNCNVSATALPGDRIRASLVYTPTSTTATVTDVTQNVTVQMVGEAEADDYALIGDASPTPYGYTSAVPTFSKVVFTQAKINGLPLADFLSTRASYQSGTDVQIAAGSIRHDGKSFVTTFRNNY